jgi:hypothetical protein
MARPGSTSTARPRRGRGRRPRGLAPCERRHAPGLARRHGLPVERRKISRHRLDHGERVPAAERRGGRSDSATGRSSCRASASQRGVRRERAPGPRRAARQRSRGGVSASCSSACPGTSCGSSTLDLDLGGRSRPACRDAMRLVDLSESGERRYAVRAERRGPEDPAAIPASCSCASSARRTCSPAR